MSVKERLRDLLKQWVQSANAGKPIPLHELCQDSPELLPELEEAVKKLVADAKAKKRTSKADLAKQKTLSAEPALPPEIEGTLVQGSSPVSLTTTDDYPAELGGYTLTKILG